MESCFNVPVSMFMKNYKVLAQQVNLIGLIGLYRHVSLFPGNLQVYSCTVNSISGCIVTAMSSIVREMAQTTRLLVNNSVWTVADVLSSLLPSNLSTAEA